MFKRDFVHQRNAYKHPLWSNFPSGPLTVEEAKELVKAEKWEELILRSGRCGLLIAGYYIQRGCDVEEMVSAAMLGICVAVDKMKSGDFNNHNPRGYIMSFIHQHCFEALQNNTLIPVPRYAKKKILTCTIVDALDGDADFDIIEFDEIMDKIVDSEFESEVYLYRRAGNTDAEIAAILDVSRSKVSRTRLTLYKRFVNHVN